MQSQIMKPLKLRLKREEIVAIKEFLKYEEARVIRQANILNCLHHGYTSSEIALILNVNQKTVTNIGNTYLEDGFNAARQNHPSAFPMYLAFPSSEYYASSDSLSFNFRLFNSLAVTLVG
jgi:hypothetical protein